MMDYSRSVLKKPEPRKRTKGRRKRAESSVVQAIRAQCVVRDGFCRLLTRGAPVDLFGACAGESAWCHSGDARRFKTRRMDPRVRHTTGGTFMACQFHHDAVDGRVHPRLYQEPLTDLACDGIMRWSNVHGEWTES